jgi:hypothetical protein
LAGPALEIANELADHRYENCREMPSYGSQIATPTGGFMKQDFSTIEMALLAAALALASQVPLAEAARANDLVLKGAPDYLTAPLYVETEPCFNSASIKPPPRRPMRVKSKHCRHSRET